MADYSYLFGGSTSSSGSGVGADLLLGWAQRKSGTVATVTAAAVNNSSGVKAPWQDIQHVTPASTLVSNALSGRAMFNPNDKAFSGANADEKNLFALHAGINMMAALAGRFDQKGVTTSEQARLTTLFESGMRQLDGFLSTTKFDALTMARAAKVKEALSGAAIKASQRDYLTGVLARGPADSTNAAFAGAISFHIDAEDAQDNAKSIDIDLADMGATPRSLTNVVGFINQKLRAAGLSSEVKANKLGVEKGVDQYGLKLTIAPSESMSFSAAATAPALYVAGASGTLMKFADPSAGLSTSPINTPNVAFAKTIAAGGVIHASATGEDGALYILADVSSLPGQPIKGQTDAALMKYDSAGNLVYTRTLGAASTASGLSLAVSDDGRVAIAGSVTGALGDGAKAATGTDSFLAVFDAEGVEEWVARGTAERDDEYGAVTFGADGGVYVAGRAKTAGGDWDGVFAAFDADGALRATQSFGGAGNDGGQRLVVEDLGGGAQRVSLASVENDHAILRQFGDDGSAITNGAVRDLGVLGGGAIAGLALDGGNLYLAGETRVGGLASGSVARAFSGGQDGFVAKLSADLVAGGGDRISYIGGVGDDSLAGFSVSAGQVYFGGDSDKTFAGQSVLRDRDGYVGRLDTNGDIAWVQRFTSGASFNAATFAADSTGASALDRLGLPTGAIQTSDVTDLVSRTSLRPGDEFSISVNGHGAQTIKILEGDTLQKLADRVERVILSAGVASLQLSASAGDKLKIVASGTNRIELRAGPAGKNALAGLGLTEGVVTPAVAVSKKSKAKPSYGLGLSSTLSLADKASRKAAVDAFGVALATVQLAFKELSKPATSTTAPSTGPVPAYLTKQLANYQAALARLGG
jgi:hypothetical protein